MQRIPSLEPEHASPRASELLSGVKKKIGAVPNIFKAFANAPAALEGYLNFSGALGGGTLPPALREQIALAVAGENQCDYCASAHTTIGKGVGLDEDELTLNLRGESNDPKVKALLSFVKIVVRERGRIEDAALQSLRDAGVSDEEIVETIAHVGLNTLTNYLNHIVNTDIDFPVVTTKAIAAKAA